MDRRILLIATVLVLAIAGPILLALHLTRQQALASEAQRALGHARDVLARAASAAREIDSVFAALASDPAPDPCSPDRIALLRRLDLASSQIQLLGPTAGDALQCFPLQQGTERLELGPADAIRPGGVRLRYAVQLPAIPRLRFLAIERDGHALLLHQDFALGAAPTGDEVSLALRLGDEPRLLGAQGEVRPQWFDALGGRREATFVEAGRVVAVVAQAHPVFGELRAVAAVEAAPRVAAAALRLVPAGLLGGLLVVLAVHQESKRRQALPAVIRAALRRGEFFLANQPVVDLATRQWVGAEALIRWQRRSGEIVQPHEFLRAAEDAGLIQGITRRVFELVARDAAGLFEHYPRFQLALNLSAADLHDETTVAQLQTLSQRLQARPGNLVIEASERAFANPRLAGRVVERLYEAGMRVALDDFGTGHSSRAQLQRIKPDYLKIDRLFIATMDTDAATGDVVSRIVEIARALELELIAEGVESEAQAALLQQRGVRYAQGWHFAQPVTLHELRERLALQAAAAG